MSTPIKPPGSPPAGGPEPGDGPQRSSGGADRAESRAGEFRGVAEESAAEGAAGADVDAAASATGAEGASGPAAIGELRSELEAGRIDVDGAIDRLVQRALRSAAPLPPADRAALEAQLRDALSEDPTLLALRRDLERASKG